MRNWQGVKQTLVNCNKLVIDSRYQMGWQKYYLRNTTNLKSSQLKEKSKLNQVSILNLLQRTSANLWFYNHIFLFLSGLLLDYCWKSPHERGKWLRLWLLLLLICAGEHFCPAEPHQQWYSLRTRSSPSGNPPAGSRFKLNQNDYIKHCQIHKVNQQGAKKPVCCLISLLWYSLDITSNIR